MAQTLFFDKKQRLLVGEALATAETLAESYFRIDLDNYEQFPFDLKTLANLKGPEKTRRALAQVCKYEYSNLQGRRKIIPREFYRICLQDDKILNRAAVEVEEMLRPLLLYVVTHELIPVIRFSIEPGKFHLRPEEKQGEEKSVHRMTHEVLDKLRDPLVEVLLGRYRCYWEREGRPEAEIRDS